MTDTNGLSRWNRATAAGSALVTAGAGQGDAGQAGEVRWQHADGPAGSASRTCIILRVASSSGRDRYDPADLPGRRRARPAVTSKSRAALGARFSPGTGQHSATAQVRNQANTPSIKGATAVTAPARRSASGTSGRRRWPMNIMRIKLPTSQKAPRIKTRGVRLDMPVSLPGPSPLACADNR